MLTAASNKTTTISRSATNRASVQAPIETAQGENAVSVDNTVGSVLAEEFTKVCPRATLRIARTLQSLCWQVRHQDATLSIPRRKKLPLSVSVSA